MQLPKAIEKTNFSFPRQKAYYQGKVRELYEIEGNVLVMVATDRISAFDHILPRPIPYKGEVLNQLAALSLKATEDIVPNWLISTPDPAVAMGHKCEPIKLEMVIRGYLVGHAWREYKAGKRSLCGVAMPDGMKEGEAFPVPIITPATKADNGHDEDISKEEILKQGIVSQELYERLEGVTHRLFQRGTELAKERGLILVDTKYEFGLKDNELYLIDEVHTPDSSRYFFINEYAERLAEGRPQRHLSKEFVREWLIGEGFQGLEGQALPEMPDARVEQIMKRYQELYEHFTGQAFIESDRTEVSTRIERAVLQALSTLN